MRSEGLSALKFSFSLRRSLVQDGDNAHTCWQDPFSPDNDKARDILPILSPLDFPFLHSSLLSPWLFLHWEYHDTFCFYILDYSHHAIWPSGKQVWLLDFELSLYSVLIYCHRQISTCMVCEFIASALRRQTEFFPSCGELFVIVAPLTVSLCLTACMSQCDHQPFRGKVQGSFLPISLDIDGCPLWHSRHWRSNSEQSTDLPSRSSQSSGRERGESNSGWYELQQEGPVCHEMLGHTTREWGGDWKPIFW